MVFHFIPIQKKRADNSNNNFFKLTDIPMLPYSNDEQTDHDPNKHLM